MIQKDRFRRFASSRWHHITGMPNGDRACQRPTSTLLAAKSPGDRGATDHRSSRIDALTVEEPCVRYAGPIASRSMHSSMPWVMASRLLEAGGQTLVDAANAVMGQGRHIGGVHELERDQVAAAAKKIVGGYPRRLAAAPSAAAPPWRCLSKRSADAQLIGAAYDCVEVATRSAKKLSADSSMADMAARPGWCPCLARPRRERKRPCHLHDGNAELVEPGNVGDPRDAQGLRASHQPRQRHVRRRTRSSYPRLRALRMLCRAG